MVQLRASCAGIRAIRVVQTQDVSTGTKNVLAELFMAALLRESEAKAISFQ